MDASMIAHLFAFAVAAGGYGPWCADHPEECVPPRVESVSMDRLSRLCGANGGCYMRGDEVYVNLDTQLGSLKWRAFVVHEMTHYLQKRTGKWQGYQVNPCHRWRAEAEAYRVQNEYAKREGAPFIFLVPANLQPACAVLRDAGIVKDTEH